MLLSFLQLVLRLLLILDGSIQQLFRIILAHLRLRLLLLLLVLLVLLLILLLLVFLIVLLLVVVALLVLLLVLLLFLLLMLAENQVIACLIIAGVQTEGILIGLYRFAIHLMRLADDTHIMIGLGLTQRIGFQLGSTLELRHSGRILLLRHQGITQIIDGLRVLGVLLNSFPIRHLCVGIVTTTEQFVTLTDILTVGLGVRGKRKEERGKRNADKQKNSQCLSILLPLSTFHFSLKQRQILQQRVTTIQDTDLQNQQQDRQNAHSLELFVELTIDSCRGLFLRQFIKFIVQLLLGGTVVLHMDIGTTAGLSNLLAHLLVQS